MTATERDIDGEARQLAADLASAGQGAAAGRLVDAIEGGATGTELLMALRLELGDQTRRRSGLDGQFRSRARDLRAAVNAALKSG